MDSYLVSKVQPGELQAETSTLAEIKVQHVVTRFVTARAWMATFDPYKSGAGGDLKYMYMYVLGLIEIEIEQRQQRQQSI